MEDVDFIDPDYSEYIILENGASGDQIMNTLYGEYIDYIGKSTCIKFKP